MSKKSINSVLVAIALFIVIGNVTYAQKRELPTPDYANVKYGNHERHVFDIWFADTTKVTPLVIYIHGGGFRSGSKGKLSPIVLSQLLKSGIAVASINYRYLTIEPLPAAHHDARRALQFIRYKAEEWKIDKTKIGAFGGSAGAQICMWLAFSDDMANPSAEDPIEKESSRLSCVSTTGGQTTMDFDLWMKWIPGYEKPHVDSFAASGIKTKEEYKKKVKAISAISIVSTDDPPIFMTYRMKPDAKIPTDPKKARGWKIHHVIFGIKLKEKMDELGVEAYLKYPGASTKYKTNVDFFNAKLFNN